MFTEDYKIYFSEFGVPVIYSGPSSSKEIIGIFDMDTAESFFGELSVRNDEKYGLFKAEDIEDWERDSTIVRNNITYYMVDKALLDNEKMCVVTLSRDKVA